ncbi:hypothetical protein [Hymenobacter sp. GOD-10R]|uniref:hypothetical protein n=1 Tax=Hymenobacter sp. GOD-10R TaxID=3093922 RepID=UPI002D794FA9|nr:hypothetical protein [Hymenobacter sp. GOD-10R]WRQ28294.1 hypothetical protein SD425_24815 [Hymenobacter sp. GOD-10R]
MSRPLATALSAAFHPLLVPSYLFYIICYQLPGVILRPLMPDRWVVLAVAFVFTFLLPSLLTATLHWLGRVESITLPDRRHRPLPFLLTAICFAAATLMFQHERDAFDPLLMHMMAGMTVAVLLTFLISLRWKISAHTVGVGGAVGFLSVLQMSALSGESGVWWLVSMILLTGAVMSARLALNAHTSAQVWAGLTLGVGVVLGFGLGLTLG